MDQSTDAGAGYGRGSTPDLLEQHRLVEEIPIREVRAGVTMVGGIALAVYENGTAVELFRMVRGQGMYGLLKRLTHSHVYVDILSGTSAGGINAIFLSTALTLKTDLAPSREVWIGSGGIDDLLQNPLDTKAKAVLDGDKYYLNVLTKSFQVLSEAPPPSVPELPSGFDQTAHMPPNGPAAAGLEEGHYRDLDLLVTGTYHEGRPRTFFDLRTQPIFTEEYHGVFRLKHRPRRGESSFHYRMCDPPNSRVSPVPRSGAPWPAADPRTFPAERRDGVIARLGRVARTTSSLPAAFEPSLVDADLMNCIIELPREHGQSYMFDGGFLNNRPLDLALEAIAEHPADREVVRKLFFVEPTPDEYRKPGQENPPAPSAAEALWFYKDVPGRQSLAGCLNAVYEQNRKVRRVRDVLEATQDMAAGGAESCREAPPENRRVWTAVRVQELRDEIITLWQRERGLEGFGGVTHEAVSPTSFEQQRSAGVQLRALRTGLLTLLEQHCREWQRARKPQPETDGRVVTESFSLEAVDPEYLRRQVVRMIGAVRDALFPQPEAASDPRRPEKSLPVARERARQCVYGALGQTHYEQISERLPELFRLLDLAEIIRENLAMTLAALAQSLEYDAAAREALEQPWYPGHEGQAQLELWRLMLGCTSYLLDATLPLAPDVSPDLWNPVTRNSCEDQAARDRRSAACEAAFATSARALNQGLALRGQNLCRALGGKQPADRKFCNDRIAQGRQPQAVEQTFVGQVWQQALGLALEVKELLQEAREQAPEESRERQSLDRALRRLPWGGARTTTEVAICLANLDTHLYPLERASGLVSMNEIELIHVSPRDVQVGFARKEPAAKLAGDTFSHFGGFFKRSWRANDILWGRLDGAGAIATTLLERERLERMLTDAHGRFQEKVAKRMLHALDGYVLRGDVLGKPADQEIPDCRTEPRVRPEGALGEHLNRWYRNGSDGGLSPRQRVADYLFGGYREAPVMGDDEGLRWLVECVLRRHHLEILCDEVPVVLAEALSEHGEWQGRGDVDQYIGALLQPPHGAPRTPDQARAELPRVDLSRVGLSGVERGLSQQQERQAVLAGKDLDGTARDLLRGAARLETRAQFTAAGAREVDPAAVEEYFRLHYDVGNENIAANIPPVVMLRRYVAALLVGLHAADNSMGDRFKGQSVGRFLSHSVLRPISLVTGAVHGFLKLLAEGSTAAVFTHTIAWAVVLLGGLAAFFHLLSEHAVPTVLALIAGALAVESIWWGRQLIGDSPTRRLSAGLVHAVLWGLIAVSALLSYQAIVQTYILRSDPAHCLKRLLVLLGPAALVVEGGLWLARRWFTRQPDEGGAA